MHQLTLLVGDQTAQQCPSPWVERQKVFISSDFRCCSEKFGTQQAQKHGRNGNIAHKAQFSECCAADWGHSDTKPAMMPKKKKRQAKPWQNLELDLSSIVWHLDHALLASSIAFWPRTSKPGIRSSRASRLLTTLHPHVAKHVWLERVVSR